MFFFIVMLIFGGVHLSSHHGELPCSISDSGALIKKNHSLQFCLLIVGLDFPTKIQHGKRWWMAEKNIQTLFWAYPLNVTRTKWTYAIPKRTNRVFQHIYIYIFIWFFKWYVCFRRGNCSQTVCHNSQKMIFLPQIQRCKIWNPRTPGETEGKVFHAKKLRDYPLVN